MSNKRKRSDTPPPHPSTLPQFKWPAPLSTKPSFLGIGAQKAGTTWLHDALASHPKFFLPPIKEVHYFNRHHKRSNISWYANHFGRATPTQTIGEITPCYSALSLVEISRIYQTLGPNCKIIFLARNIIERSYSAALMELRNNVNGLEPSCFTKESDYKNLTDCHPDRFDDAYFMGRFDHVDFVGRSDYATTLKNYISIFGKDNLFVGNFEDIKLRPVELLAEIVEFLGGEKGGGGGEGEGEGEGEDDEGAIGNSNDIFYNDLKEKKNANTSKIPSNIRTSLLEKMHRVYDPLTANFNKIIKEELGLSWEL